MHDSKLPATPSTEPTIQSQGGKARWKGVSGKKRSDEMRRIALKRWATKSKSK